MTTSLDYLKQTGTVVVSDSGDFECKLPIPFLVKVRLIGDYLAIDVYKPQVLLIVVKLGGSYH